MDNIILYKVIVIMVIVWWGWSILKSKQKQRCLEPAIAQANARERYQWRYFRWGWRVLQIVCGLYLLIILIQFLVRC
ncbi:hypothetical protein ACN9PN_03375 [Klebsiella pasteurii]|uniref:hypothetical protein n=1 Tax=Klebsiella pasteurii TaxID=2587529 RepID=UPI002446E100|nr:hypothetical protein [Klebsiella pasteurii]MDH0309973.1 hypothetical protein [Klebsiella pasteurii]